MKKNLVVQLFVTLLIITSAIAASGLCKTRIAQDNTDTHSTSMNNESKKNNAPSVTADLKEVPPSSGAPKFAGLSATVTLDKIQRYQQGGIKMLITLTNKGETSVSITNPLENTYFFLLDKEGRNIKLPPTISRHQIDAYKGGEKPTPDIQLPFHLFLMTLNGRQLDSKEINGYKFDLAAGDTLQIGAKIDKIVKKSSSTNSGQSAIIHIPPGYYQIKAALYLHDLKEHAIRKDLESEPIKVQLVDKEATK